MNTEPKTTTTIIEVTPEMRLLRRFGDLIADWMAENGYDFWEMGKIASRAGHVSIQELAKEQRDSFALGKIEVDQWKSRAEKAEERETMFNKRCQELAEANIELKQDLQNSEINLQNTRTLLSVAGDQNAELTRKYTELKRVQPAPPSVESETLCPVLGDKFSRGGRTATVCGTGVDENGLIAFLVKWDDGAK